VNSDLTANYCLHAGPNDCARSALIVKFSADAREYNRRMDANAFRIEVWHAVGTLWKGFGADPEAVITKMFPQASGFVEEMFERKETPESSALQLVTNVLGGYIEHGMPVEQKRAVLLELHAVMKMSFEEAESYPALPFVAQVVAAWIVARQWAAEGKVDTPKQLLQGVISSLAAGLER
jgi:hypothetical protein